MTKTYTPLIIEGKIYVVVDAPDEPIEQENTDSGMAGLYDAIAFRRLYAAYERTIAACTKYPTIEADAPYWKERIGQRVEVEVGQLFKWNDGGYYNRCSVCDQMFSFGDKRQPVCKPCCETTYAIPPQQKQDDGDLWDEAEAGVKALQPDQPYGSYSYPVIIDYLKQHYQLIKRK